MKCAWPTAAKILTGFLAAAVYATPQTYTVSAKPGVVNYVEGNAFVNGRAVSPETLKATFLNVNDVLSTDIGKAEVLLSPGVFLRMGDNSRVRMVSASLTDVQVELKAGEAMVEADDIVKDNRVTVVDGNGSALIERNGLYRFTAGDEAKVAVLEGKATVFSGDRKMDLGKGREALLADAGKTKKFDTKQQDDLYAWSNVRAEYNAASSYQAAQDVNASSYGGVWGGYGYSGFTNPGWMWNSAFNSYAWLPGNGAFYSPFGFGFYGPGMIGYAPLIYAPVGGGYGYRGSPTGGGSGVVKRPVPVNPVAPPAIGRVVSPAANQMARTQALHSYASSGGFRTATGSVVPVGHASAATYGGGTGHAAVSGGSYSSPGAISSGHASSAASVGASGAGGHSGGGASAGGGHH